MNNKTHRKGEENSEKNNVILPSNELSLSYVVETYNMAQTPRSDIGLGAKTNIGSSLNGDRFPPIFR